MNATLGWCLLFLLTIQLILGGNIIKTGLTAHSSAVLLSLLVVVQVLVAWALLDVVGKMSADAEKMPEKSTFAPACGYNCQKWNPNLQMCDGPAADWCCGLARVPGLY